MADNDKHPPEMTPWGPKQEEWEVAGFSWVSTPRHGGIYLTPEQRKDIPDLIKPHSSDTERIWWEEDSAWSLPVVYLLSQRPHDSLSDEEDYLLERAHDTARDWFPDEWEQMTGREIRLDESYSREVGRDIALERGDDLLAGTIWRSSPENSWVPEGMVGVAAYPGKAFLESNMDPARTHAARYFLIPEAEVKWRTPPFEINNIERYQEVTGREGTPPAQTKEAGAERGKSEARADMPQRDTRRDRARELDDLIKQQDEKQKAKEEERVPERHTPDRDR